MAYGGGYSGGYGEAEPPPPPAVPALPHVRVRLRWGTGAGQTYFDLTTRTMSVETEWGRGSPLEEQHPAGTATLTFDDTDGLLDPDNTASPLFGRITPGGDTTIIVDHQYPPETGAFMPLFLGAVQTLSRSWPGGAVHSITTMRCVDSAQDLMRHIIAAGTVFPEQLPGPRIAALLGQATRSGGAWASRVDTGTPPSVLGTGARVLGRFMTDGQTPTWQLISQAAASDTGIVFINRTGQVHFIDGEWFLTQSPLSWTLGDEPGQVRLEDDLTYTLTEEAMVADASYSSAPTFTRDKTSGDISHTGGFTGIVGPGGRTVEPGVSGTATQLADQWQATSLAQHVYSTFSVPKREVEEVTLNALVDFPDTSTGSCYRFAVNCYLGQRVRTRRTPPGGGVLLDDDFSVESVRMSVSASPAAWSTTVRLTPYAADRSGEYWTLNVTPLGQGNVTW